MSMISKIPPKVQQNTSFQEKFKKIMSSSCPPTWPSDIEDTAKRVAWVCSSLTQNGFICFKFRRKCANLGGGAANAICTSH